MLKNKTILYEQMIDSTIALISSDGYLPGDKLPSERVLADRFNCNYHTLRKAVQVLCDEGVLEQRPRLGTFVKKDARYLATKSQAKIKIVSTRKIGVLLLSDNCEYFNRLLMELERAATQSCVQIELSVVQKLNDSLNSLVELEKSGCKSLIVLTGSDAGDDAGLKFIIQNSALPVAVGISVPGFEKSCHAPAEKKGWYRTMAVNLLCDYFIALGREQIAFLGGESSKKFVVYNRYVSEHGLLSLGGFVGDGAEDVDACVRLWKKYKGKLAVICENDIYAMRLLNSFHKLNWKLPEDVAVAGFNNFSFSALTDPPLTSVQFPYKYLAQSLIRRAVNLAEGIEGWDANYSVPQPELIIRESCGGSVVGKAIVEKLIANG